MILLQLAWFIKGIILRVTLKKRKLPLMDYNGLISKGFSQPGLPPCIHQMFTNITTMFVYLCDLLLWLLPMVTE